MIKFLDKIGWWIYDKLSSFMDKHGSPRPISREEMDKIKKQYEEFAKENPDKVIDK